jgi:pimeloyl-ACP methyl ester carboxylesterase
MPFIQANGQKLHYTEVGEGTETIVFSHGYLMNHTMYAHQINALKHRYRVIAYDQRGHGESGACHERFSMDDLVTDAEIIIEKLVGGPAHFVGMSTGGFVGTRLLIKRPDLLNKVVLIDTSAAGEKLATLLSYKILLALVYLFGKGFITAPLEKLTNQYWQSCMSALDSRSIVNFGHAIFSRKSVLPTLRDLKAYPKTLILVGENDIPTPPLCAKHLQAVIGESQLSIIPECGHTSPVEKPTLVTQLIERFLLGSPSHENPNSQGQ